MATNGVNGLNGAHKQTEGTYALSQAHREVCHTEAYSIVKFRADNYHT